MTFTIAFIRFRAKQIQSKVELCGTQQVRLWNGRLMTYPHPAPRGYGTRGAIVGIYKPGVDVQWIEDDLQEVLGITHRVSLTLKPA